MNEKQNILGSEFSYCFDNAFLQSTYILSKQFSTQIWRDSIDIKLDYFDLSVKNLKTFVILDNWLECYNDDQSNQLKHAFDQSINWGNDDLIYFCISKVIVLESTWSEFKIHWRGFLCINDDSPVVINPKHKDTLLMFNPLGSILKIIM